MIVGKSPLLTETILFYFDGDLKKKMNVNEMKEMKEWIKKQKPQLCVFGKRNDFTFDVWEIERKKGKYIIQFHSKETKTEQDRFHENDKEGQDSFSLCEVEEESYKERMKA